MGVQRVAVFVDGDNVSPAHAGRIRTVAASLGRPDIVRVYVAGHHASDWLDAPGYRPIHAGSGKNAADLLLCIDAIEFALAGDIACFVLATSDRDFTHLAQRLRERGAHVLGIGERKAPEAFRLACTAFEEVGPDRCGGPSNEAGNGASEFDLKIRSMIAEHSQNGRGMPISLLAPRMHARHRVRISDLGKRTWRAYFEAHPELYDLDPRGPAAMVRFRPGGFASRGGP